MDPWSRWARLLWGFVDQYDQAAITLLLFLEEAGLPLPLPGDVLVLTAGFRIAQGSMPLVRTTLLLVAATISGASVMYWLGARMGRPLLYKFGKHLRLKPERLDKIGERLRRRGWVAILLGRITPGLRIVTPLAAGAFGVPFRVFLPAMAAGSTLYLAALLLLGAYVGPRALEVVEAPELGLRFVLTLVLGLVVGGTLVLLYRQAARGHELPRLDENQGAEAAALAGVLATLEMAFVANLAIYALGWLGFPAAGATLMLFVDSVAILHADGNDLLAIAGLSLLLLAVGVVSALVYDRWASARFPGPPWLRGLLFGAVPFALWSLVLLPLLGAGFFGLELGAGAVPLAGELLRHALFGIGLGLSYPLLLATRAADGAPMSLRVESVKT